SFFFFQAEDGIRDRNVTGVQTCALPILSPDRSGPPARTHFLAAPAWRGAGGALPARARRRPGPGCGTPGGAGGRAGGRRTVSLRSEERRVGEECRSGW